MEKRLDHHHQSEEEKSYCQEMIICQEKLSRIFYPQKANIYTNERMLSLGLGVITFQTYKRMDKRTNGGDFIGPSRIYPGTKKARKRRGGIV